MTPLRLSRNQRRELRKLARLSDRMLDTDRRFFRRFPDRRYRVRQLHRVEIRIGELVGCELGPLPPGHAHICIIYAPRGAGTRLRLLATVPREQAEPDLGETTCKHLFEQATQATAAPDQERIRTAMQMLEDLP